MMFANLVPRRPHVLAFSFRVMAQRRSSMSSIFLSRQPRLDQARKAVQCSYELEEACRCGRIASMAERRGLAALRRIPVTMQRAWRFLAALGLILLSTLGSARAQGGIVCWGDNSYGQCDVPALPSGVSYIKVAAGNYHSVARRSDGSVVAWGSCGFGQCLVPALPGGLSYVGVAAAGDYCLARRSDGSVVAWGDNSFGQCNVPALPSGLSYVEVAAGGDHAVARRSDGSVVAWGDNSQGQCDVPVLPSGLSYVEVAAGEYLTCPFGCFAFGYTVARRSDGSVVAWGNNFLGQCDVPALPGGLTYVEVAAGGAHVVARRSDGSVVAWGNNGWGECDVPALPSGLSYVEVTASVFTYFGQKSGSGGHSVARRSDGSVVAWGDNSQGQCNVPALPSGFSYTQIAAGWAHNVARYGPLPACGSVSLYCSPARANSVSAQGASLTAEGCPGLTANSLVLNISGLPRSKAGMLLYSTAQQQVPFGNGSDCLSGGTQRVLPPRISSPAGTIHFPIDLTQYPFSGSAHTILPSSTWNFQLWYRDSAGNPAKFNTSNALHIVFAL